MRGPSPEFRSPALGSEPSPGVVSAQPEKPLSHLGLPNRAGRGVDNNCAWLKGDGRWPGSEIVGLAAAMIGHPPKVRCSRKEYYPAPDASKSGTLRGRDPAGHSRPQRVHLRTCRARRSLVSRASKAVECWSLAARTRKSIRSIPPWATESTFVLRVQWPQMKTSLSGLTRGCGRLKPRYLSHGPEIKLLTLASRSSAPYPVLIDGHEHLNPPAQDRRHPPFGSRSARHFSYHFGGAGGCAGAGDHAYHRHSTNSALG
jgi:hypothetical protein